MDKKLMNDEILENSDFIDWLVYFTNKNNYFIVEDMLRNKDLDIEDKKNLLKFKNFFSIIEAYAKDNYVSKINLDETYEYAFLYRKNYFKIGTLKNSPGLLYYIRKTDKENRVYIDFLDILDRNNMRYKNYIENELDSLKKMIATMYKKGISLDAIIDSVSEITNEIRNSEDINNKNSKIGRER